VRLTLPLAREALCAWQFLARACLGSCRGRRERMAVWRVICALAAERHPPGSSTFTLVCANTLHTLPPLRCTVNTVDLVRMPADHQVLVSKASKALSRETLAKATLVTSTAPCPMCAGAIYWCVVSPSVRQSNELAGCCVCCTMVDGALMNSKLANSWMKQSPSVVCVLIDACSSVAKRRRGGWASARAIASAYRLLLCSHHIGTSVTDWLVCC
jgi:hypothetical protein